MKEAPIELWQSYAADGNVAARDALVRHYLTLVDILVRTAKRRLPKWVDDHLLWSSARMGLLQAMGTFRPGDQVPFAAYAQRRINGAMLDELRKFNRTRRAGTEYQSCGAVEDAGWRPPDPSYRPHEDIDRADQVRVMLSRFSPRDARVLMMKFGERRTHAEIGAAVGLQPSRICQIVARARAELRSAFPEMVNDE